MAESRVISKDLECPDCNNQIECSRKHKQWICSNEHCGWMELHLRPYDA